MTIRTLAAAVAAAALALPALAAGHKKPACPPEPCAMVPEYTTATRTVMKCQMVEEKRVVTVMERVPEERLVRRAVCRMVPETREVDVVRHVRVPVIEEKTVTRCVKVSTPVEKTVTRCVDMGHVECQPVGCKGTLKPVWVSNPVMQTDTVVVNETHREKVQQTVQKVRMQREAVCEKARVTTCRPVMEMVEEKCVVMVCRPVTKEVVVRVPRMVPVTETYTVCRMVPAGK
ncbi:MAG: hypothetical protein ACKO9Z_07125 [Planctomycetota bacterium]|jgi:hypothetical protein|nr:hypothetical protein [Planctomycetota bacterium]